MLFILGFSSYPHELLDGQVRIYRPSFQLLKKEVMQTESISFFLWPHKNRIRYVVYISAIENASRFWRVALEKSIYNPYDNPISHYKLDFRMQRLKVQI